MPRTQKPSIFAQQVVVITGGASGIGLALAQALHAQGARLVLGDVDAQRLQQVTQALSAAPHAALSQVTDVTSCSAVAALIARAEQAYGRIDYLFNNAGIGGTLPIHAATLEHWQRLLQINLWGVIYGIDAVLPLMLRQGSGHIINTASISGLVPVPGQALYNTSKYAVVGLSESLRYELEASGIRLSCVCPGRVATAIWGVPILGTPVAATPPKEAIPSAEAARSILAGVAKGEGLIIFPASERSFARLYRYARPLAERMLRRIAAARR